MYSYCSFGVKNCLLTYLLTPWCWVLLEKLTGLQLVKKFPAFHGTRRFITSFTSVRHLSLSWASPIQSIYPHPTSWRSVLIVSTHLRLGLPSGLFPSGSHTKTLYPLSIKLVFLYTIVRGSFQEFCTLYVFSLKLNLFYKIHLQAFNLISIVLYHSGPTFRQVLYSCQEAFVFSASDYSGHLIRHLLSASEAFPTEWFLQFWEQVKGCWSHVRTVRRVRKHLPSILFQNFRYCTWGMRPRVNLWSLATARDLTPVSFFFHFKAPFCRTRTT